MKNRKVLIIDDEVNLLRSMQRNLRTTYDVAVAEGGVAAVAQILQNGPFAVVVSDLQMREIDGIQVLAIARLVMPDAFRIMLTGNVTSSIRRYGADDETWFQYLNKPCTTERLCQMLNEGIDRPQRPISSMSPNLSSGDDEGSNQNCRFKEYQADSLIRCQRLRDLLRILGSSMRFAEIWQYELAVMLSHINRLVRDVPPRSSAINQSQELSILREEAECSSELIRQVPRLECISQMIRLQYAEEFPENLPGSVRRGSGLLRMLTDYEMRTRTESETMAIRNMTPRSAFYGDDIFQRFSEMVLATHPDTQTRARTQTTAAPEQKLESLPQCH